MIMGGRASPNPRAIAAGRAVAPRRPESHDAIAIFLSSVLLCFCVKKKQKIHPGESPEAIFAKVGMSSWRVVDESIVGLVSVVLQMTIEGENS